MEAALIEDLLARAIAPRNSREQKRSLQGRAFAALAEDRILDILDDAEDDLKRREFFFRNPHSRQREILFVNLAVATGCDCIKIKARNKLAVIGFESDINAADFLYGILARQLLEEVTVLRSIGVKEFPVSQRNALIVSEAKALGNLLKKAIDEISGEEGNIRLKERKAKVRQMRNEQPELVSKDDVIKVA